MLYFVLFVLGFSIHFNTILIWPHRHLPITSSDLFIYFPQSTQSFWVDSSIKKENIYITLNHFQQRFFKLWQFWWDAARETSASLLPFKAGHKLKFQQSVPNRITRSIFLILLVTTWLWKSKYDSNLTDLALYFPWKEKEEVFCVL